MSFALRYKVDVIYVPDGLGPQTVPTGAFFRFEPTANNPNGVTLGSGDGAQASLIPGANTPSAANLTTAFNNMVTDLNAQVTAALLARIQGFATGGG